MKKFEEVANVKNSEKWRNSIKREQEMYSHVYGLSTMRTEFDRDYTRIINCNAYKRLKHKTQVFFSPQNDHICTRSEHVSLVESVSYSIANYLGLNTELTKAISVAHDLGHSPFGHQGEKILSTISERELGDKFWHEKNGLHFVDDIELLIDFENKKRNLNLTYAVRDGIISHCGEIDEDALYPRKEYINLNDYEEPNQYSPYTWEGCVVKIADKISYIGRDIEDAKQMKLLSEKDIDRFDKVIEKVRINNSNIINYLVVDLCENSSIEGGLKFSEEALDTIYKLKRFNNEKIYMNDKIKPTIRYFTVLMTEIFYTLQKEFSGKNTIRNLKKIGKFYPTLSEQFIDWICHYFNIEDRNNDKFKNKIIYNIESLGDYDRAIIDYMSGMTDNYLVKIYQEIVSF